MRLIERIKEYLSKVQVYSLQSDCILNVTVIPISVVRRLKKILFSSNRIFVGTFNWKSSDTTSWIGMWNVLLQGKSLGVKGLLSLIIIFWVLGVSQMKWKSFDFEEVVGVKYGVWEVDRYRSGS